MLSNPTLPSILGSLGKQVTAATHMRNGHETTLLHPTNIEGLAMPRCLEVASRTFLVTCVVIYQIPSCTTLLRYV